jgi:hypothetical protein
LCVKPFSEEKVFMCVCVCEERKERSRWMKGRFGLHQQPAGKLSSWVNGCEKRESIESLIIICCARRVMAASCGESCERV